MRFIDVILEPALWFAADWSLRWALLIGVAMLSLCLLRPRRAASRQLLCLVALLGGLLLPFTPRWGGWRLAKETAATPQAKRTADDFGIELLSGGRQPPESGTSRGADAPRSKHLRNEKTITAPPPGESLGNRRLAVLALVLCWSIAVMFHLIRWLGGWWFLQKMRRGAMTLQGSAADVFAVCRGELGISDEVRLAEHPRVHSPILLGLFQPLILVPPNWFQLPSDVQRAGLLHELAHVRRRDHWLAPLLEIIRIAFFFHPPLRWLLVRLECERELLCDEMVVGRGIDRHDYARMLLDFARQSSRLTQPHLLSGSYLPIGRRRTVKVRIHHLLEDDMERWIRPLPARWAVVLGAGLLVLMLGLASYRIVAEEPEKTIAPHEKMKEASTKDASPKEPAAAKLRREALRYAGKNFDQWRVELETELKPEIRADGLTALAAFGANGYGSEAARTIIDLMGGYDLQSGNKKDDEVVEAAFDAIRKIGEPVLPVLWEGLRSDNRRIRRFAIISLDRHVDSQRMRPEAAEIILALSKAIRDSNNAVSIAAIHITRDYGAKAKSVVPALLKLLDKPIAYDQFDDLMGAIAAIGSEAKDALPRLRKLRDEPSARRVMNNVRMNVDSFDAIVSQRIVHTIKEIEGK